MTEHSVLQQPNYDSGSAGDCSPSRTYPRTSLSSNLVHPKCRKPCRRALKIRLVDVLHRLPVQIVETKRTSSDRRIACDWRSVQRQPRARTGLCAEGRSENAMGLPTRRLCTAVLEGLVPPRDAQPHRATETLRPATQALHRRHPVPLPLATAHQPARRHQQQDQSHQPNGLRLPRRPLLLPQNSSRLPRNSVMNRKLRNGADAVKSEARLDRRVMT